ncbi:hypothetical protein ABES02_04885 [Neobacillus pocheonensis]|uniref:hypothetical protein n=1 Tax=Neobacillus pocheonensis TaxID=363869 RepID=UPI003D2E16ED
MDIPQRPLKVLSSGPIITNPNTKAILLEILNIDLKDMKKVIIEIKNWTNLPAEEIGKFVFQNGKQINPEDIKRNENDGNNPSAMNNDPSLNNIFQNSLQLKDILITYPPINEPIILTVPSQYRLSVLAIPPIHTIPLQPTIYEIRLTLFNSINFLVSSFGLNADGFPQEGNTILFNQFFSLRPNPPIPPSLNLPQRPF